MLDLSVTTLVEGVLKTDLQTRNSDLYLLVKVWEKQGYWIPDSLRKAIIGNEAANPESVRRVRQKLQAEGHYQADPLVKQARAVMQEQVTEQVKGKMYDSEQDYLSLF